MASLEELRVDPSIYLTEEIGFKEDVQRLLDSYWEWIFREQLNSWSCDPETWPDELTRDKFHQWFDCELSTMIWEMLDTRIKSMD